MAVTHDNVRRLAWALSEVDEVLDAYCPDDCDEELCDGFHQYAPADLNEEVTQAKAHLHNALAIETAHVVRS